jgi:hypothetical protein
VKRCREIATFFVVLTSNIDGPDYDKLPDFLAGELSANDLEDCNN